MNIVLKHFYQPLEEILTSEDIIELNSGISGKVVVELPGQGRIHRDYPVLDRGYWVRLCTVLANLKRIDFDPIQNPIFSTQLPGGHRLQAIFGSTPVGEFGVSIRVKRVPRLTLKDFGICGAFAEELIAHVKRGSTILISGGTSSGKTSFMNLLIKEIPGEKRILTVEDTKELIIPHEDNEQHIVSRNDTHSRVGYSQIIDHFMRSRPDIVLSGEVSIANSFPILRLLSTGHGGFMTTIHADTPLEALRDTFPQNIQLAELNIKDPFSFLKSKIDLVIQLSKIGLDERGITEAYYPKQERHIYFKRGKAKDEKKDLNLGAENRFEAALIIAQKMREFNITVEEVAQVARMERLKNEAISGLR